MRLKISSIIICLVLAAALIVVAKTDGSGRADKNNETITESEAVFTYKPLKSVVESKPFVLSGVYEIKPEKDIEEKEETTTEIAMKEIEIYNAA